jgi:hypothetical protein
VLKERLGDVASRPRFDQNQIDRVAATAAESAVAQLRLGLDDVAEAQARTFDRRLVDLEARLKTAAGQLPPIKGWREGMVVYAGEVATSDGNLYQARVDTGSRPGSDPEAWVCVACAGQNGKDGASVSVRGEWTAKDAYGLLDIVTRNGCSYIAIRPNPGRPADDGGGWMMLAGRGPQGETGKQGLMGPKGDKGEPAATFHHWEIDGPRYRVIGALTDGSILPPIELRPLFAQYQQETSE